MLVGRLEKGACDGRVRWVLQLACDTPGNRLHMWRQGRVGRRVHITHRQQGWIKTCLLYPGLLGVSAQWVPKRGPAGNSVLHFAVTLKPPQKTAQKWARENCHLDGVRALGHSPSRLIAVWSDGSSTIECDAAAHPTCSST